MSPKGKKILLVEDDQDIRSTMAQILKFKGYEVVEAQNGQVATEVLEKDSKFDLILLDLMMPIMGGVEFRKAQLEKVEVSRIPVIFLSADQKAAEKVENLGAKKTIRKPVKINVLLASVEKALL